MKEVIGILILLIGFSLVGTGDYTEAQRAHIHYCIMVDKWVESKGVLGHPNYDDRDCSTAFDEIDQ
tara:strand:+ start:981 stop:1178 length:198 start_codon:yes stop_codon:yes gene_type:complete